MKSILNKLIGGLLLALAVSASGAELPVFKLTLKDHQFSPAKLSVPLGKKFKLVIANQDAQPAEFESFVLHREQVVVGKGEATVYLGPLKAGRYEFFDDFHAASRGTIEAAAESEAKK
jgi:hypothetical protein